LSGFSISDPNKYVTSNTTTYDLRWGTPDKNGPAYATLFNQGNSSYSIPSPINIWGNTVTGYYLNSGPTYAPPHPDVIAAWNNGWTGKGVNVVIADALTDQHGVITANIAGRYAPGSTFYGIPLDFNLYTNPGNVFNLNGTNSNLSSTNPINAGVINLSFGANYTGGVSDAQRLVVDNNFSTLRNNWVNILQGSFVYTGLNLNTAVITKAAGNDAITADKESFVKAFADNNNIQNRLLIVGALNFDVNGKGFIASYSNTAGTYQNVSNRFLVASGGTPFNYGDIAINGYLTTFGAEGTSFAAPRVAGYAAIIEQKFPNLDAAKTSNIILDTARYDTLACNPNCDPSIYGKGQASLSRALAPVGRLR
jgi:hypothetical protein